jgi:hypothetical protein
LKWPPPAVSSTSASAAVSSPSIGARRAAASSASLAPISLTPDGAVVSDADGSNRVEVPGATSVAWSTDGTWLAYARADASLWRVHGDGSAAQQIQPADPEGARLLLAGWSPDGARQHFQGTLTLRRSVVDGASAEQRRWHIYTADIREQPPAQ